MKVTKEEKETEKKEEGDGKTIVVGVRMDQQSKEVLTWALVKIALPGDQVIALHILPSSFKPTKDPDGNSLNKGLESMLAAYDGFCNLKQIDLKLKVCRGSSLRRVLVREVNSYSAAQLILGVAKDKNSIGPSPISIAKHCAKKLPRSCSVIAVSNGKIVFQREALENNKKIDSNSKTNLGCGDVENNGNPSSVESRSEKNCSICDPLSMPQGSNKSKELDKKSDGPLGSSVSIETQEASEARTGWPLLRKSVFAQEKTKVSVVQWAMRLPTRYSTSHLDRKPSKTNSVGKSNLNGVKEPSLPNVAIYDKEGRLRRELECLQEKYSSVCRMFSYKELMDSTSNFSVEMLIGKGGSSRVYKGCLLDGKELAVKVLKPTEAAVKEFVSEIEIITTLHHKNIISLLGFCFSSDQLILVYDFLSRGSLEESLHGEKENKGVPSWAQRYKVAIGVAEALDYLHEDGNAQCVIHRDVKSSNILLSEDFQPKLSDFGFATWASASTSLVTGNDVAGTFGYLAPEYFIHGRVSEKIDVYAFGVVLLELLSGRRPISTGCPQSQQSLVMWAIPILQGGKAKELVDPCLSNEYDSDQMERMILAASLCIKRVARSRPRISLVLKLLRGDDETLKWAKSQVSASEESDELEDDEAPCPNSNLQSYLDLALLDVEDDSLSVSSTEHTADFVSSNTSLEDYLQGRCSRSSSFD